MLKRRKCIRNVLQVGSNLTEILTSILLWTYYFLNFPTEEMLESQSAPEINEMEGSNPL